MPKGKRRALDRKGIGTHDPWHHRQVPRTTGQVLLSTYTWTHSKPYSDKELKGQGEEGRLLPRESTQEGTKGIGREIEKAGNNNTSMETWETGGRLKERRNDVPTKAKHTR